MKRKTSPVKIDENAIKNKSIQISPSPEDVEALFPLIKKACVACFSSNPKATIPQYQAAIWAAVTAFISTILNFGSHEQGEHAGIVAAGSIPKINVMANSATKQIKDPNERELQKIDVGIQSLRDIVMDALGQDFPEDLRKVIGDLVGSSIGIFSTFPAIKMDDSSNDSLEDKKGSGIFDGSGGSDKSQNIFNSSWLDDGDSELVGSGIFDYFQSPLQFFTEYGDSFNSARQDYNSTSLFASTIHNALGDMETELSNTLTPTYLKPLPLSTTDFSGPVLTALADKVAPWTFKRDKALQGVFDTLAHDPRVDPDKLIRALDENAELRKRFGFSSSDPNIADWRDYRFSKARMDPKSGKMVRGVASRDSVFQKAVDEMAKKNGAKDSYDILNNESFVNFIRKNTPSRYHHPILDENPNLAQRYADATPSDPKLYFNSLSDKERSGLIESFFKTGTKSSQSALAKDMLKENIVTDYLKRHTNPNDGLSVTGTYDTLPSITNKGLSVDRTSLDAKTWSPSEGYTIQPLKSGNLASPSQQYRPVGVNLDPKAPQQFAQAMTIGKETIKPLLALPGSSSYNEAEKFAKEAFVNAEKMMGTSNTTAQAEFRKAAEEAINKAKEALPKNFSKMKGPRVDMFAKNFEETLKQTNEMLNPPGRWQQIKQWGADKIDWFTGLSPYQQALVLQLSGLAIQIGGPLVKDFFSFLHNIGSDFYHWSTDTPYEKLSWPWKIHKALQQGLYYGIGWLPQQGYNLVKKYWPKTKDEVKEQLEKIGAAANAVIPAATNDIINYAAQKENYKYQLGQYKLQQDAKNREIERQNKLKIQQSQIAKREVERRNQISQNRYQDELEFYNLSMEYEQEMKRINDLNRKLDREFKIKQMQREIDHASTKKWLNFAGNALGAVSSAMAAYSTIKSGAAIGGLIGGPPGAAVGAVVGAVGTALATGANYLATSRDLIEQSYNGMNDIIRQENDILRDYNEHRISALQRDSLLQQVNSARPFWNKRLHEGLDYYQRYRDVTLAEQRNAQMLREQQQKQIQLDNQVNQQGLAGFTKAFSQGFNALGDIADLQYLSQQRDMLPPEYIVSDKLAPKRKPIKPIDEIVPTEITDPNDPRLQMRLPEHLGEPQAPVFIPRHLSEAITKTYPAEIQKINKKHEEEKKKKLEELKKEPEPFDMASLKNLFSDNVAESVQSVSAGTRNVAYSRPLRTSVLPLRQNGLKSTSIGISPMVQSRFIPQQRLQLNQPGISFDVVGPSKHKSKLSSKKSKSYKLKITKKR